MVIRCMQTRRSSVVNTAVIEEDGIPPVSKVDEGVDVAIVGVVKREKGRAYERNLTARRSERIESFRKMLVSNPQKYGVLGSKKMMQALLDHINEPLRNSVPDNKKLQMEHIAQWFELNENLRKKYAELLPQGKYGTGPFAREIGTMPTTRKSKRTARGSCSSNDSELQTPATSNYFQTKRTKTLVDQTNPNPPALKPKKMENSLPVLKLQKMEDSLPPLKCQIIEGSPPLLKRQKMEDLDNELDDVFSALDESVAASNNKINRLRSKSSRGTTNRTPLKKPKVVLAVESDNGDVSILPQIPLTPPQILVKSTSTIKGLPPKESPALSLCSTISINSKKSRSGRTGKVISPTTVKKQEIATIQAPTKNKGQLKDFSRNSSLSTLCPSPPNENDKPSIVEFNEVLLHLKKEKVTSSNYDCDSWDDDEFSPDEEESDDDLEDSPRLKQFEGFRQPLSTKNSIHDIKDKKGTDSVVLFTEMDPGSNEPNIEDIQFEVTVNSQGLQTGIVKNIASPIPCNSNEDVDVMTEYSEKPVMGLGLLTLVEDQSSSNQISGPQIHTQKQKMETEKQEFLIPYSYRETSPITLGYVRGSTPYPTGELDNSNTNGIIESEESSSTEKQDVKPFDADEDEEMAFSPDFMNEGQVTNRINSMLGDIRSMLEVEPQFRPLLGLMDGFQFCFRNLDQFTQQKNDVVIYNTANQL